MPNPMETFGFHGVWHIYQKNQSVFVKKAEMEQRSN